VNDFLTGAGHFGFGFVVGTAILVLTILCFKKNLFVQIYAPFIPFVLGGVAALPYSFFYQKTCDITVLANIFFFYSWAHCQSMIIAMLGNLHLVVLVCACVYGFIVLRYITLVKRVRRHGWKM
jgi:hypothetical protein